MCEILTYVGSGSARTLDLLLLAVALVPILLVWVMHCTWRRRARNFAADPAGTDIFGTESEIIARERAYQKGIERNTGDGGMRKKVGERDKKEKKKPFVRRKKKKEKKKKN
jgi:hypothetical protein